MPAIADFQNGGPGPAARMRLTRGQLRRARALGATTGLADVRADGAVFLYGRLGRHTVRWLVTEDGTVLDTARL